MRHLRQVLAMMLCCAVPALAEAPGHSLRPLPRPAPGSPEVTLTVQANLLTAPMVMAARPDTVRPRARPVGVFEPETTVEQVALTVVAPTSPQLAVLASQRPVRRPRHLAAPAEPEAVVPVAAVRIQPGREGVISRKGSVCGEPGIKGEQLAPITSRVRGCGIADPVRVTSVSGVRLSMAATLDCPTARALNAWVKDGLQPAFGRQDVIELKVAGHYVCRTRDNIKGAPISEHGRGKAIDISGIVLANGKLITVLGDWRGSAGKPMVKAYRAACGTFGTTLGPNADRYHRDHMHFDTARQSNGPYCR